MAATSSPCLSCGGEKSEKSKRETLRAVSHYLTDARLGKLPFAQLKKFLKESGKAPNRDLWIANTKAAHANLERLTQRGSRGMADHALLAAHAKACVQPAGNQPLW